MREVLIVAPTSDLHAQAVAAALRNRSQEFEWLDLGDLGRDVDLTVQLNGTVDVGFRIAERRVCLTESSTVWWRRPKLPDIQVSLPDATTAAFVRDEWQQLIGCIEAASFSRWVNLPSAARVANHKSMQLAAAATVGLRIPRTVITNSVSDVRPLLEEGLPLIYKHLGGVPRPITATRALRAEDVSRLDVLHNCPAIFQEKIDAQLDIRVTAIGASLHTAEIHSQVGGSPLDWRFDHSVPFKRHTLDAGVGRRLQKLMRMLNLEYAAIDLRLTPQGEYVFLEVNPYGQYLFVELLAGIPLSECMSDFLTADATS